MLSHVSSRESLSIRGRILINQNIKLCYETQIPYRTRKATTTPLPLLRIKAYIRKITTRTRQTVRDTRDTWR